VVQRQRDKGKQRRQFPKALLDEARRHPDGWVYEIDPQYDPLGAVPPEGIIGAWRVGRDGHPTGEFTPNPKYRQST
jgi:hypothetical protein